LDYVSPDAPQGLSGTRPVSQDCLPLPLLKGVESWDALRGQNGAQKHDPRCENTGDSSTGGPPVNRASLQKPSKDAGCLQILAQSRENEAKCEKDLGGFEETRTLTRYDKSPHL